MPEMNNIGLENKKRRLHRRIVERFVIIGKLRLETPAHFGNGETDAFTDMPLIKDELDGSPLLPGTSIAGALRSYLRERELGYGVQSPLPPVPLEEVDERSDKEYQRERNHYLTGQGKAATLLFGAHRGDDEGRQSPLIIRDALGNATDYELRDGVRIEAETRTAEDEKKYDIALLAAGSAFDMRFELLVSEPEVNDEDLKCLCGVPDEGELTFASYRVALLRALATALDGLSQGEITLGARKRRGFGHCRVAEWKVQHYDLRTPVGLIAWLAEDHQDWVTPVESKKATSIATALGEEISLIADERKRLRMTATFQIDGSLMVRAGVPGSGPDVPDMAHLQSPRPDDKGEMKLRPILAGTSWAGALRSRATKIAYTLAPAEKVKRENIVRQLIDDVFGPEEITSETQEARASRVEVAETEIVEKGIKRLEQTRIKIDRFTGGAFESALFSEQPLFGNRNSRIKLELVLRMPAEHRPARTKAEIGLLLLLLKDLWTGDLPLGGEVGIGRGILKGIEADIKYGTSEWRLQQSMNGNVNVIHRNQPEDEFEECDRTELQSFVAVLRDEVLHG